MRNIILVLSYIVTLSAQDIDKISDFYEYVNLDWFNTTKISGKEVVINEAGLQWETVKSKSIALLSDTTTVELDNLHLYTLTQLRSYYSALINSGLDPKTSFEEMQEKFPMIFGIVWSEIHYSDESKMKLSTLYEYTHDAYQKAIETSTWLDDYHKALFLNKLMSMTLKSGAPNLTEYPKLPTLVGLSLEEMTSLINTYTSTPQDPETHWPTSPCEPDCFYLPGQNRIIINAGVLLDLDTSRISARTFATIGRTIAHEMTHAFDAIGQDYDGSGRKIGVFKKLLRRGYFQGNPMDHNSRSIINQYSNFEIGVGLNVNGKKTLLESHADIAGVEVSYQAFKMFLHAEFPDMSKVERDTELRSFFISNAQMWREISTDDFKRKSLERIHAPQKFRATGPIYNQDDFYTLFDIDPESAYYLSADQRVNIWK